MSRLVKTMTTTTLVALALALAVAATSSSAQAQEVKSDRCGGGDTKAGAKGNYERIVRKDGTVVYKMKKAFVLCGTVPKPEVLYGLLNTTINYEWENLKQELLPKVLRSVEQAPF